MIKIKKICGRKYVVITSYDYEQVEIEACREVETFDLQLRESVAHQYYKMTRRLNRLLAQGRRCRGDILTA